MFIFMSVYVFKCGFVIFSLKTSKLLQFETVFFPNFKFRLYSLNVFGSVEQTDLYTDRRTDRQVLNCPCYSSPFIYLNWLLLVQGTMFIQNFQIVLDGE